MSLTLFIANYGHYNVAWQYNTHF